MTGFLHLGPPPRGRQGNLHVVIAKSAVALLVVVVLLTTNRLLVVQPELDSTVGRPVLSQ